MYCHNPPDDKYYFLEPDDPFCEICGENEPEEDGICSKCAVNDWPSDWNEDA